MEPFRIEFLLPRRENKQPHVLVPEPREKLPEDELRSLPVNKEPPPIEPAASKNADPAKQNCEESRIVSHDDQLFTFPERRTASQQATGALYALQKPRPL